MFGLLRKSRPNYDALSKLRPRQLDGMDEILGINMRNALIQKYNPRIAIERARDKVAAKVALEAAGIACTGTVAVIDDHQKLGSFKPTRDMPDAWAIKPARGSQGDGILLAVRREGNTWYKGSGTPLTEEAVMHHIQKVVDGGFSGDSAAEDAALIEPLIIADPAPEMDATRGTVCKALVQSIDLLPTFIEHYGGACPDHLLDGTSLRPLLTGAADKVHDYVVSEYDYHQQQ